MAKLYLTRRGVRYSEVTKLSLSRTGVVYEDQAAAGGDTNVAASVDALTLTEQQATVALDVNVSAGVDALTLTEFQAAISTSDNVDVQANVDALTLTEHAATVANDVNVSAGVDALTLTTHQASALLGTNVQANVDTLTLTANQATITFNVDVQASVAALALTEYGAGISGGAPAAVDNSDPPITGGGRVMSTGSFPEWWENWEEPQPPPAALPPQFSALIAEVTGTLSMPKSPAPVPSQTGPTLRIVRPEGNVTSHRAVIEFIPDPVVLLDRRASELAGVLKNVDRKLGLLLLSRLLD